MRAPTLQFWTTQIEFIRATGMRGLDFSVDTLELSEAGFLIIWIDLGKTAEGI